MASARNAGPEGAGPWSGPGIAIDHVVPGSTFGLGVRANVRDDGSGLPLFTTFAGVEVDANSVLVAFTHHGDADLNGRVDAADYHLVDRAYALGLAGGWAAGDFDYSGGPPDVSDYLLMDAAFLYRASQLDGGDPAPPPAVPEPAAVALAALGALAALRPGRPRLPRRRVR